jgi:hypothetical protein
MLAKDTVISQRIDELLANEEEAKSLDRKAVELIMDEWLYEF